MKIFRDEQGIALVMSLWIMALLSVLIIAFLTLATAEVRSANNQLQHSQAFYVAESGIAFARWGLNNPTNPNGITGSTVKTGTVGAGSYSVTVTFTSPGTVDLDSVGVVGSARSRIKVSMVNLTLRMMNAPAAVLATAGNAQVGDHAFIDGVTDTVCGVKAALDVAGVVTMSGSAVVKGTKISGSGDLGRFQYSDVELSAARLLARRNGGYFAEATTFSGSNPLPSGVVVIDGDATLNPGATASGWKGVLLVEGSVTIGAGIDARGVIAARDDVLQLGGRVSGLVVGSGHDDGLVAVAEDGTVLYSCGDVRTAGGTGFGGWRPLPNFREVSG